MFPCYSIQCNERRGGQIDLFSEYFELTVDIWDKYVKI